MRVSEIQGAIARVQLKRLDFILSELKKRKDIYRETLIGLAQFEVVEGYSLAGECNSSIHLLVENEEIAMNMGKTVRSNGILFAPVTSRPAHAVWQWGSLLGARAHIQSERNPYTHATAQYSYSTSQFLQSVEILMRTLKMDINIHLSLEETAAEAKKLRNILTHAK